MKKSILLFSLLLSLQFAFTQTITKVAPGIWKITYGTPEKHLPTEFKEQPLIQSLKQLPDENTPPFNLKAIHFSQMPSGFLAEIKVDSTERFYGFGLQINSFEQRYEKRDQNK